MRKIFPSLLLFVVSVGHATDPSVRPGLWEITTTSMLLALVPRIPPEQMQQLTKLAKQYGLDLPRIENGAATSRICITRKMADQEIPSYLHVHEAGCSIQNALRTGNDYKMDLVCTNPQLQGKGRAEGSFTTPESFSGWTVFTGTMQNTPVNEHADTTGRWISANCGKIKSPR